MKNLQIEFDALPVEVQNQFFDLAATILEGSKVVCGQSEYNEEWVARNDLIGAEEDEDLIGRGALEAYKLFKTLGKI